jgi:hypothetical protein
MRRPAAPDRNHAVAPLAKRPRTQIEQDMNGQSSCRPESSWRSRPGTLPGDANRPAGHPPSRADGELGQVLCDAGHAATGRARSIKRRLPAQAPDPRSADSMPYAVRPACAPHRQTWRTGIPSSPTPRLGQSRNSLADTDFPDAMPYNVRPAHYDAAMADARPWPSPGTAEGTAEPMHHFVAMRWPGIGGRAVSYPADRTPCTRTGRQSPGTPECQPRRKRWQNPMHLFAPSPCLRTVSHPPDRTPCTSTARQTRAPLAASRGASDGNTPCTYSPRRPRSRHRHHAMPSRSGARHAEAAPHGRLDSE